MPPEPGDDAIPVMEESPGRFFHKSKVRSLLLSTVTSLGGRLLLGEVLRSRNIVLAALFLSPLAVSVQASKYKRGEENTGGDGL